MTNYDTTKCAESAKIYSEARNAARMAAGNLERSAMPNEDAFLAEVAHANDVSRSPRPVAEDVVQRYARELNARQKAEDEDARAKNALKDAKKAFEKEMDILRSKV